MGKEWVVVDVRRLLEVDWEIEERRVISDIREQ